MLRSRLQKWSGPAFVQSTASLRRDSADRPPGGSTVQEINQLWPISSPLSIEFHEIDFPGRTAGCVWFVNRISEWRNRKRTNPVINVLLLQRRREYFEASLMKMGMELEATQSVRNALSFCLERETEQKKRTNKKSFTRRPSARRWSTTSWCFSRSTCPGTCCARTPRCYTSSCPSNPTTSLRGCRHGACSPASPSTSTPTKSWSGTRWSTSPHPLRRTAWNTSTSGTGTTSSHPPWGAGWWAVFLSFFFFKSKRNYSWCLAPPL